MSFRRAPWGRKIHLLPLPVLSVVLLVTAMAAPGLLRMTVTIIDDPNMRFTASVQNVVHPDGPTGKIVGIMTVTNHASLDMRITTARARIQSLSTSGNPDGRLDTTIEIKVPLVVRAGAKVQTSFSGPFAGNVLSLRMDDSFRITPLVTWLGVSPSGTQGPYTYAQVKVCSGPGPSPSDAYWISGYCHDA